MFAYIDVCFQMFIKIIIIEQFDNAWTFDIAIEVFEPLMTTEDLMTAIFLIIVMMPSVDFLSDFKDLSTCVGEV